jgi:hypothetical protein
MKKLLVYLVFAVVLVVGTLVALHPKPCVQPDDATVAAAQNTCIEELKAQATGVGEQAFRDELCKVVGKEPGCLLIQSTDEDAINRFIVAKIDRCTALKLKAQNICTDKK